MLAAYAKLPVGHPLQAGTLVGPLIDADAVEGLHRCAGGRAGRRRLRCLRAARW
ncbi:MAG: hypothetical protein WKG07_07295 [Hymenobacter sp.]